MSVIDDALRTAQREKELREQQAGGGRPFAPVLVRLRSQPRQGVRREFVLAGAAIVVVGFAAFLWYRVSSDPALPAIPPVTSTILSEALADPPASGASKPVTVDSTAVGRDTAVVASLTPTGNASRAPQGVARQPGRVVVPPSTPGRIDIAPRPEERITTQVFEGQPRQAGTLRIAMEPVRGGDAAQLFSEALAAHRARDYARARLLYEQVLVLSPGDGDALNNLAVLLSADRQFDRALELLRRASIAAPRNAGVWNNIGSVLREQGHGAEAIAAFQQALAIDSRHQGARVGLAQQQLASNALDAAAETLQGVLADNPNLAEAHYTLGQVREQQRDVPGAISAYSAFVRHAPERLASHVELVRRRIEALGSQE